MKILQISFSNINNLKGGPHLISFEQAPLDKAGIFAILGPTGSGKSTILDVITLALFNKIPRFKKSISKKEMTDLGSVMTLHSGSAEAQITYEVKGQRFTSKWSVSKARTGKLKEYEMFLMDASGNYLDLKKSEVPAKNEAIIGLKYDQFVKSIILSQGEFSKFLKAGKNERGELLENITGTKIYRKLGSAAFQKFKEVENNIKSEIDKLGEIHVLSDEEIKEIKSQIDLQEKEKKTKDDAVKELIKIKQLKIELFEINKTLQLKKDHHKSLKEQISKFTPYLSKLVLHEKISPFKGDLSLYKVAKKNAIQTEQNLKSYRTSLNNAEEGLKVSIEKMAQLTSQAVNFKNFKNIMSKFEKEVNKMDNDLQNIKEKGKELRGTINEKLSQSSFDLDSKIPSEKALVILKEKQTSVVSIIKKAGFSEKEDVSKQKASIQEKSKLITEIQDLVNYNSLLNEYINKEKKTSQELKTIDSKIKQIIPIIEKSKVALDALIANEQNLEKRKNDALKIAKLEDLRLTLEKGEACPLCGSENHPYAEHLPEQKASSIEKEIKQNHSKKKKEQEELKKLEIQLSSLQTSIEHLKKDLLQIETSKSSTQAEVDKQKALINKKSSLNNTDFKEQLLALKSEVELKQEALEAISIANTHKELIKGYQQLIKVTNEFIDLNKKRKEKFEGEDPSEICNKIQDEFNNHTTSKSENAKAIEIESKDLVNAKSILEKTEKKLNPKLPHFGFKSIDELDKNYLNEEEYQEIKNNKEALSKQETALETEIKTLINQKEKQSLLDIMPDQKLEFVSIGLEKIEKERDAINRRIGEYKSKLDQDLSLRKRRAGKEKTLNILKKELEKWSVLNKIIGDKYGNKFATFAQGITLKNLMYFTNKRLVHLTDRYLLDKPKDGEELVVVDQYQGNIERAVTTLSGGETFLISLALALSLSDMASKNVPLDSLFIDEGFGTLDQESLDIALNTLERLQSESQKMVGVISHVDSLKERINVQIKLVKNAQGYSKIQIEN